LYDFATGNLVDLLKGHTRTVFRLAFSPDGRWLISGSGDHTAIIWDINSRRLVYRLVGHKSSIMAVAFMPDSTRVVTGSDDTTLRLWRADNGKLVAEMHGHSGAINHGLAVRLSDSLIASGDVAGEIRLWD